MNTQFDQELKFLYVWDRRCPERVLAIGRKFMNNKLCFTWCLNKVIEGYDPWFGNVPGLNVRVLDRFDKKLARHICSERFKNSEHVFEVDLEEDQRYSEAILRYINDTPDSRIPRKLKRITRDALLNPFMKQNEFYEQAHRINSGSMAHYRRRVRYGESKSLSF